MGKNYTRAVTVSADRGRKIIKAEWPGGAYVDLSFGGYSPSEVINVYDYATGTYDKRVHSPAGLRAIVREWINTQDEEWPEWYAGYVDNARGY